MEFDSWTSWEDRPGYEKQSVENKTSSLPDASTKGSWLGSSDLRED